MANSQLVKIGINSEKHKNKPHHLGISYLSAKCLFPSEKGKWKRKTVEFLSLPAELPKTGVSDHKSILNPSNLYPSCKHSIFDFRNQQNI